MLFHLSDEIIENVGFASGALVFCRLICASTRGTSLLAGRPRTQWRVLRFIRSAEKTRDLLDLPVETCVARWLTSSVIDMYKALRASDAPGHFLERALENYIWMLKAAAVWRAKRAWEVRSVALMILTKWPCGAPFLAKLRAEASRKTKTLCRSRSLLMKLRVPARSYITGRLRECHLRRQCDAAIIAGDSRWLFRKTPEKTTRAFHAFHCRYCRERARNYIRVNML